MNNSLLIALLLFFSFGIIVFIKSYKKKSKLLLEKLDQAFSEAWRLILQKDVRFYSQLNDLDKNLFEKRIQLFLATKKIEAIDAEIDDSLRLMVASSAIIPTFAFPEYNYPGLQTILIYPNSFDEHFKTKRYNGHEEFIIGMVGDRYMKGTVILSKPDLLKAFDGHPHKENVGVHEFVHLLDKEDGAVDGIPQLLIDHAFVGPWLHEIKKEMDRIRNGKSDINPYAITNNAEFLAVVSEYFFDSPEKFKRKHAELYAYLSKIFNRDKVLFDKM